MSHGIFEKMLFSIFRTVLFPLRSARYFNIIFIPFNLVIQTLVAKRDTLEVAHVHTYRFVLQEQLL